MISGAGFQHRKVDLLGNDRIFQGLYRKVWDSPLKHKQSGRLRTSNEIRDPVLKVKNENTTWRTGRILGELLKLGIELDRRTDDMMEDRGPTPDARTSANLTRVGICAH